MIGTHVVLLREPQTNAAKVFLFGESGTAQTMKLWRFFAADDIVRLPAQVSADTNTVMVEVDHPDDLANDLFCNGHSILPDGKMVFVGGNYTPRDPCEMVYTFDPAWMADSTSPWTLNAKMAVERWYATITALPDGNLLAAAGESRSWLGSFGGLKADGTTDRIWRPLTVAGQYQWADTLAVPANENPPAASRVRNDHYTAGKFPPGRVDHAFSSTNNGTGVVLGGLQILAGGAADTLEDAWLMRVTDPAHVPNDSVVTWTLLKQVDYDSTTGAPEVIPPARTRAAMVWAGMDPSNKKTCLPGSVDSLTVYLFGGLDSEGKVLSDMWVGHVRPQSLWRAFSGFEGLVKYLSWEQLLPDDTPSRARFGHSMWFDPGRAGVEGAPHARLVIFGGQVDSTTLADNRVYTYGVGSAVEGDWRVATPDSTSAWGSPQPRQGHAFAQNWTADPAGEPPAFFLYGGQDAAGNLLPGTSRHPETNDTHLWALERHDATASNLDYKWKWLAWTKPDSGSPGPPSRARAAMAYESWSKRLVVTGGDLNGDGQSGGLTDSVYSIQVESYGPGDNKKWKHPIIKSNGSLPEFPPASGHTLIAYGTGGHILESSMEVFSPQGSLASCGTHTNLQGTWSTLTTPDADSERDISAYPYLFVLPDGRLFNAGPSPRDQVNAPYRRFFNFGTKQWSDDAGVYTTDAKVMGSAVMYRPGKILRAGSHGPGDKGADTYGTAHSRTETIDIGSGTMPAWVQRVPDFDSTWPLVPRLNHNLTNLPTGDVLASGGVSASLNPQNLFLNAIRRPQLWRSALGGWNDTASSTALQPDPKIRNYHSTALLLPDGRVMTAGGEDPNEEDRWTVSIYEPPYLFAGDEYARRPIIADGPEVLRYGEPFTMVIDTTINLTDPDSIRSVALLRPAAVTHGFDQNQRYVPLDFVPRSNPKRLLAWAPVDGFVAPPGEYMLFVTRGRGNSPDALPVPSLAKWVVLKQPTGSQADSLDVTLPRGGAGFNLAKLPCETGTESPLQLHLSWTAPADDDSIAFSGRARSYNLRWIPNSDSRLNFNLWTSSATGAPNAALTAENAVASPVSSGTWYRFGLKAVGDNADTSALGLLVATRVQCSGGSSGGGGGEHEDPHMRRAGGLGQRPGMVAPPEENTLFEGVPLGTRARDVLRLTRAPGLSGSTRRAFVRQGQERGLLLDRARLLAVDHAEGTEIVVAAGSELLSGQRLAAASALDRRGRDVTAAATGGGEEPVYADSGEVLIVTLPAPSEPTPRVALLDLMGGSGTAAGVTVAASVADGSWEPLATVHPRRGWDTQALPPTPATQLRLTFHGAYALRFAGVLAGAAPVTAQAATMSGAESNYSGDAFDQVRSAADTNLAMVASDTLSMVFEDLAPVETGQRTWLLEVEGTPVMPREAQALAHRRDPAPQAGVPLAFALHPSAPNPTHSTVRLGFDLPTRAPVRLEIFDAQGRRVRRFDGDLAAGRHAFEWDLRHSSGPRVAPGVYTYRLTAGRLRAQNKMVVLP